MGTVHDRSNLRIRARRACEAPRGFCAACGFADIRREQATPAHLSYAPGGVVRVVANMDCRQSDPPQPGCRISVIDQGPGIDPARLNQMFQPFSRGETHGQQGMGLGLSIARQAAQLLGARLWAESTPGQGAQFHLDFPTEPPVGQPVS